MESPFVVQNLSFQFRRWSNHGVGAVANDSHFHMSNICWMVADTTDSNTLYNQIRKTMFFSLFMALLSQIDISMLASLWKKGKYSLKPDYIFYRWDSYNLIWLCVFCVVLCLSFHFLWSNYGVGTVANDSPFRISNVGWMVADTIESGTLYDQIRNTVFFLCSLHYWAR